MSGSGSSLRAPGSINDSRTKAHLEIGQRLGSLDLSPLLLYTISGAPASALQFLAWQFDISSPFDALLAPGASQISLVQQAISIHRYKGAQYAIGAIMNALGFPVTTIQEGQASWGGTQYPASQGWAVFRVLIAQQTGTPTTYPAAVAGITDVASLISIAPLIEAADLAQVSVTAMTEAVAVAAINFFKPTRSLLDSLWFVAPPASDALSLTSTYSALGAEPAFEIAEFISAMIGPEADVIQSVPLHDDHFRHCGLRYGGVQPGLIEGPITAQGYVIGI